jgi:N utilization substance protein B
MNTAPKKRPPQTRTGLTDTGVRKAGDIDLFTRDLIGFHKADAAHFDALLHGCLESDQALDALITPHLDRKMAEISPVEHAVLWIGAYELQHCLDVPWRVILNECIELAKAFGGTDGHKWVNGVLNQLAPTLRAQEVARDKAG